MNDDFEKLAKAIAEKALCNQKREEDDYIGEDGLLYCGKCHTPKQYRVKGFSGDICPCVCQCVEKQREQDERARKIAANRQRCFPFMEQHKATFANDRGYNTAITQAMHNYVEHFETLRNHGKGLLLYGPFGSGKSYHSYQVANALLDLGYRVKVAQFEDLAREEQSRTHKNAFFDELTRYDLVVLDDLGAEKKSPSMNNFFFTVIDKLYLSKTPFVITTNLSIDEIKNPLNEENGRIYQRILERCPYPIKVERESGSIRLQLVREESAAYKTMLGL
jgi:DNA replication protein DnaC